MNVKTVLIISMIIATIGIIPIMAKDEDSAKIEISDTSVQFHKFNIGDSWSITLKDETTHSNIQFNGKIGDGNTTLEGNNWWVYFKNIPSGHKGHAIRKCVIQGEYDAKASGTIGSMHISEEGNIEVKKDSVCSPPIPTPELSTYILTSVGLVGLFGLVKLQRR